MLLYFITVIQVAHEREVKGQVALQFRDISQQVLVVERSLTATQKVGRSSWLCIIIQPNFALGS